MFNFTRTHKQKLFQSKAPVTHTQSPRDNICHATCAGLLTPETERLLTEDQMFEKKIERK